jgi:hypothetical protein
VDLDRPDRPPHRVSIREAFLFSLILHLTITLILLLKPDLFPVGEKNPALTHQKPGERLVMLLEPPTPFPLPPLPPAPVQPAPMPPAPPSSEIIIPRATQPAPPDEQPQVQNDLPFSKGNSDEFVTDKEEKKPGDAGEGEKAIPASPSQSDREPPEKPGRFGFNPPTPRPRDLPLSIPEDIGKGGEEGPFENLRRFLLDKQYHNPDGGLLTGRNNTLYYNPKGADFVPWITRMLHEVKKHWLASMPFAAYYQKGHVAVGVAVNRDGSIAELKQIVSSRVAGFDNAAVGALRASRLLPLPADYPDQRFDFILVFWYNEQPYEIFQ